VLLAAIGHSGGSGRDMPVQVSVALLATQAEAVPPSSKVHLLPVAVPLFL
jgi:hypothetical protein